MKTNNATLEKFVDIDVQQYDRIDARRDNWSKEKSKLVKSFQKLERERKKEIDEAIKRKLDNQIEATKKQVLALDHAYVTGSYQPNK